MVYSYTYVSEKINIKPEKLRIVLKNYRSVNSYI